MYANTNTLETAPKTVLETYVRQVEKLVHLTINGEEIVTTDNHPFYVQGRGFINAGSLLVGDKLISVNGEDLFVEKHRVEELDEPVDVYNFQVEDYHTYFVGDCAVWVHNAECGGSYKDVKKKNAEENHGKAKRDPKDAHHMPAHDAYPDYVKTRIGKYNKKANGPSISMENADHTQTASYDNKPGAKAYRAKQKKLIQAGKFQEAFDMDVADIKSKFPGKYDLSIQQAQECLDDIIKKVKS